MRERLRLVASPIQLSVHTFQVKAQGWGHSRDTAPGKEPVNDSDNESLSPHPVSSTLLRP